MLSGARTFSASHVHRDNTPDTQENSLYKTSIMQNDNSKQDHAGQEHMIYPKTLFTNYWKNNSLAP